MTWRDRDAIGAPQAWVLGVLLMAAYGLAMAGTARADLRALFADLAVIAVGAALGAVIAVSTRDSAAVLMLMSFCALAVADHRGPDATAAESVAIWFAWISGAIAMIWLVAWRPIIRPPIQAAAVTAVGFGAAIVVAEAAEIAIPAEVLAAAAMLIGGLWLIQPTPLLTITAASLFVSFSGEQWWTQVGGVAAMTAIAWTATDRAWLQVRAQRPDQRQATLIRIPLLIVTVVGFAAAVADGSGPDWTLVGAAVGAAVPALISSTSLFATQPDRFRDTLMVLNSGGETELALSHLLVSIQHDLGISAPVVAGVAEWDGRAWRWLTQVGQYERRRIVTGLDEVAEGGPFSLRGGNEFQQQTERALVDLCAGQRPTGTVISKMTRDEDFAVVVVVPDTMPAGTSAEIQMALASVASKLSDGTEDSANRGASLQALLGVGSFALTLTQSSPGSEWIIRQATDRPFRLQTGLGPATNFVGTKVRALAGGADDIDLLADKAVIEPGIQAEGCVQLETQWGPRDFDATVVFSPPTAMASGVSQLVATFTPRPLTSQHGPSSFSAYVRPQHGRIIVAQSDTDLFDEGAELSLPHDLTEAIVTIGHHAELTEIRKASEVAGFRVMVTLTRKGRNWVRMDCTRR